MAGHYEEDGMTELQKDVEAKYGREVWANMERLADFMAEMILKYGSKVLAEREARERKREENG